MFVFFFKAEDGIRDLVRSRGLGDVYKRQVEGIGGQADRLAVVIHRGDDGHAGGKATQRMAQGCLLYTSDAADERSSVDLGGRRIIKKKNKKKKEKRKNNKQKYMRTSSDTVDSVNNRA